MSLLPQCCHSHLTLPSEFQYSDISSVALDRSMCSRRHIHSARYAERRAFLCVSSSPCYTFNCLNFGFAPFVRLSSQTFHSVPGSSNFNIHKRHFNGQTCSLWWERLQLLSSRLGSLPFVYYSALVSPEPLFCSCVPPLLSFVHSGRSFFSNSFLLTSPSLLLQKVITPHAACPGSVSQGYLVLLLSV